MWCFNVLGHILLVSGVNRKCTAVKDVFRVRLALKEHNGVEHRGSQVLGIPKVTMSSFVKWKF